MRAYGDPVSCEAGVCFGGGAAVYRLTANNVVEHVAGHPAEEGEADGWGADARMQTATFLSSDGKGALYCRGGADEKRVTRLLLPRSWLAGDSSNAAPGAGAEDVGEQRVRVTALPFTLSDVLWGLAWAPWGGPNGSLVMATRTALNRLPLGGQAVGEGGDPVLLAGREGSMGLVEGRGEEARFNAVCGFTVDAEGAVLLADCAIANGEPTTSVRRVAPDGVVTTLTPRLEGSMSRPTILPNGYLALGVETEQFSLLVLDLGLKPPPLLPPAPPAPAGPPRRTLHSDMGALLDAQPDGTADLILVVGDRRFPVHRAILIARCDYFRSQLEGGFADGAAAELSLPDADSAAFELLLRFVYTGAVDIPAALAPAVAELADRLLLPELCADAQAVVLSGVSAETAWYLEHHEEVHTEASLKRLMAESPDLMVELHMGAFNAPRGSKRQRTG
ncbi:hypothetical protein HYH03_001942 [Edaphochlamys debaryana]|uniref:BTB domain-containing protein n=1 Tax=Edaphochlamys debaryana TaxID=47281 RepID=A0A836C5S8_9CHLO|nr:hypothetical protein HYH03_001942 [Edaphochlamys debaryana]|eukprot:KAG2500368.1 hypothetical protein HYH03_001942 [Edaphochlamys debaryana]